MPPAVYLPPIVRDPVPVIPADPPIVNTFLPDPEVLEKLATPPVPKQISISGGKRGDPEPYIFGHCIADPILIAADDSGETLAMDMLWSVGEIDYFEGLLVDRVFEGRADMLGNMEHFEGTAGQAASTIMTALKGSYDTLANKAHSVLRWRSDYATLQIQGWVRGLLLIDPRVSPQLVYSTNPALALARVLVDCGYTLNWSSVGDAADYCDELIGSPNVKRWEIGGQITRRAPAREWISALALYANCFVDRIGDEVYLIPDMPRSSNHTVTADDMILESVRISHAGGRDVPSAVTVYGQSFEVESLITGVYTSGPISYTYGTPDGAGSVAELQMPFLQTVHACGRMAEQIYRKAHNDMTLEFIGFDDGLQRTIGDVGSITNAAFDLSAELMTLIENEQIDRGRWRRKYVQYNASNYSDVIYTSTGNDTTLYNPFYPPPGPTPSATEETVTPPDEMAYNRFDITFTGSSWAYVQDYYVTVTSSTGEVVLQTDVAHTGTGTHTTYTTEPLTGGVTYTINVYIRSNVNALSATPGTLDVLSGSNLWDETELTSGYINPNGSGFAELEFGGVYANDCFYAYAVAPDGSVWGARTPLIDGAFVDGEYLLKYEVVSVVSGGGDVLVNFVSGVAGTWYELNDLYLGIDQTTQPSPLEAEHVILDVTVAANDGAGAPVSGTYRTKRVNLISYKGVDEYLVNDTFTDPGGTNLTAHTPDKQVVSPGGWTLDTGTFTVGTNGARRHIVSGGDARAVIDAGTANACIKADVQIAQKDCGLIARRQDANNYWELFIDDADQADPILKLNQVTAGVATTRDSFTMTGQGPIATTGDRLMQLMCNGNDIRGVAYITSSHVLGVLNEVSYTSTALNTETHFGVHSTHADTQWDQVCITDLEVGLII